MMDSVQIEKLLSNRYHECVAFLHKHYFSRETMSITSGLSELNMEGYHDRWLEMLKEGVSLAAVDPSNNQIVGVSLNVIVRKSHVFEMSELPKPVQMIVATIYELEKDYDVFEETATHEGLELRFLCVHENYGGRNIAQQLTQHTINLAKSIGYGFVVTNPTSPITFHIFQKNGMTKINQLNLHGHLVNEELAFPKAQPEDKVGYFVLKLSESTAYL